METTFNTWALNKFRPYNFYVFVFACLFAFLFRCKGGGGLLERAREIPDTANSATEIEKSTEHRHNKRLFPSYEGYFAFAGKQTTKNKLGHYALKHTPIFLLRTEKKQEKTMLQIL